MSDKSKCTLSSGRGQPYLNSTLLQWSLLDPQHHFALEEHGQNQQFGQ